MMRRTFIALMIASVALLGACRETETASTIPPDETVQAAVELSPEQLGELGAKIEQEPDRASELLAERGLNEESFETAIRKITEDPEASKRYAEAYEKAKA
ncbi:MAG TPA: hypothetical protein VMT00_08545 [Thermoanaerobaculia bacterium]|nr:hypothetical protein [Thermoanaerobaculia bacterium]